MEMDLKLVNNLRAFFETLNRDRNKYTDNEKVAHLSYVREQTKIEPMTIGSIEHRLIYLNSKHDDIIHNREKYLVYAKKESDIINDANNCNFYFCAICVIFGQDEHVDGVDKGSKGRKSPVGPLRSTGFCGSSYSAANTHIKRHEISKFHTEACSNYMKIINSSRTISNVSSENVIGFPKTIVSTNLITTDSTTTATTITTTTASSSKTSITTISSMLTMNCSNNIVPRLETNANRSLFSSSAFRDSHTISNSNVSRLKNDSNQYEREQQDKEDEEDDENQNDWVPNMNSTYTNRLIVYDIIYCVIFLFTFGKF